MTLPMSMTGGAAGTAPARQANLRAHNLGLVLRHVAARRQPVSRADVAAGTGLTRATVSALVDDLVDGRLLTEVAPPPRAGAGRPGVGLVLGADGPAGLGLEINIDYLAACVVDLAGSVRHRVVQQADQRPAGPDGALAAVAALAGQVRTAAEADGLVLTGAALAVPGLVDGDGLVRLAPNLGWRDVDPVAGLRRHPALAGLPVTVDNEANLAALGELHAGPAGPVSFLYVSGEIGVGAGIILAGSLYRGARGWSGELGHLPVRPEGPVCRCGARGCLEQYAGQEAILRAAGLLDPGPRPRADGGPPAGIGQPPAGVAHPGQPPAGVAHPGQPPAGVAHPGQPPAGVAHRGQPPVDSGLARLAALAAAGDTAALRALAAAADALGVAVAGVVNLLDVQTVVLGGSYTPLEPWLGPGVQAQVDRRVLTAGWSPVTVRASALGGDAAVVGAAGAVIRRVLDNPAHWLTHHPH